MNWTRLSAIAEILSSIAILATLIYLAIQIQQNSVALQSSTREAAVGNAISTLNMVVSDPQIWLLRSKAELTPERVKLGAYLYVVERGRNIWMQYQSGAGDENTWTNFERVLIGNLAYEQSRKWWANSRSNLPRVFSTLVDTRLQNTAVLSEEAMIWAFE